MKYIRLYQTTAQQTADANNLVKPYVLYNKELDNVTYVPISITELNETSESYITPIIDESGSTTVYLTRTLSAGSWNSFCVPFAINETEIKTQFGDNARVSEFTEATSTTLNFSSCTNIEAGKPYLLYIPTGAYANKFCFKNVTSFVDKPIDVIRGSNENKTIFRGYFHKDIAPKGSYVLSKNLVYHLQKDMMTKAFRAVLIDNTDTNRGGEWSLN